ncbi:hypothetical protein F5890DRAFT_1478540 [Lentinula detonsa]|uniref:Uncharacterized protein n=1 Tax=Lentinula detonsa TaxID=2804962 RepID=A0AA38PPT0_9AGAR|nr:hypothetical protein F5890DRAFT_1478540 [Lentinula detonsa]
MYVGELSTLVIAVELVKKHVEFEAGTISEMTGKGRRDGGFFTGSKVLSGRQGRKGGKKFFLFMLPGCYENNSRGRNNRRLSYLDKTIGAPSLTLIGYCNTLVVADTIPQHSPPTPSLDLIAAKRSRPRKVSANSQKLPGKIVKERGREAGAEKQRISGAKTVGPTSKSGGV